MEMNCASFAKPSIETFVTTIKIVPDLLSQTRAQHLFANTILLMLVVSLSQPSICKMGKGLVMLQQLSLQ